MKYLLSIVLVTLVLHSCKNTENQSDAYGNFESESTIVSAEIAGKILELRLEEGQTILQGENCVVIDTTQAALSIAQIKAQAESVKAKKSNILSQVSIFEEQKKVLEVEKHRIERLIADGASTQQKLDNIVGQISIIEKQIASTKTQFTLINKELTVLNSQLDIAVEQLQKSFINSPISGTVLNTYAEEGELIMPGKAIFKVVDLSELTLKVYISGAMLPSVKIGQKVDVIIDADKDSNQTLKGNVSWISSEAEFTPKIIQTKEERVKLVYAVKVKVKNDGRLKIGMPGEIKL